MSRWKRVAALPASIDPQTNQIIVTWIGPDEVERTYSVRKNILDGYDTAEELKAAIDLFTQYNFGYTLDDLFIHRNDDGSWAVATGTEPNVWPEDDIEL